MRSGGESLAVAAIFVPPDLVPMRFVRIVGGTTEITNFADIEEEFIRRVHTMVWCSMATVDGKQRPRSRIMHLLANPYVSLAYIGDAFNPVYADCRAEWVDNLREKQRIWDLFLYGPPPVGYDPEPTFGSFDHPDFGVLKLTPWRIALVSFPAPSHDLGQRIWRRRE
jgi:hypothetical protein